MIKLNTYISEAWGGMKQHALESDIEDWCKEMDIKRYTINDKGEIDVIDVNGDGGVWLNNKDFEELPYKFGTINGYFSLSECKNLTSLKNCPNYVDTFFDVDYCSKLDSLEGCPKRVGGDFYCRACKRKFTKKEVKSLCEVKRKISI